LLSALGGCLDRDIERTTVLVAGCIRDGNTRASCECMADSARTTLDPPVFQAMAMGAEGRQADASLAYDALTDAQKETVPAFVASSIKACNLTAY
jgi:hypothetical protein